MNKVIIFDLLIKNMIFTKQCFILIITNPTILGSDFLDIYFSVLDISDHNITLHCTDYMITTSLTLDPIHNQCLAKMVEPAATEELYKQFKKKKMKKCLNLYCHTATALQNPTTTVHVNSYASIITVTSCIKQCVLQCLGELLYCELPKDQLRARSVSRQYSYYRGQNYTLQMSMFKSTFLH